MVGENRVTPLAVKEIAVDDMKKFPIRVRLQPCNSSDKHSGAYYVYLVYAYCTVEPMSQTVFGNGVCKVHFNMSIRVYPMSGLCCMYA